MGFIPRTDVLQNQLIVQLIVGLHPNKLHKSSLRKTFGTSFATLYICLQMYWMHVENNVIL